MGLTAKTITPLTPPFRRNNRRHSPDYAKRLRAGLVRSRFAVQKIFLKKSNFRCCTFSFFGSIHMKTLFRQVLPLLQVQLGVRFRKGAFAKPDIVAKASFTDLHFLVMTRNFFVLNTYAFSFRVRLNQYIIFGENSSEIHLCHVVI